MVDTLGIPTIFFTHNATDFRWPDLARLFQESDLTKRRLLWRIQQLQNGFIPSCLEVCGMLLCRNSRMHLTTGFALSGSTEAANIFMV